jgi:pyruvate/2-oxoglutarate dehydrogenase complex dihydrolipoamide dehydrogenase (E3) component
MVGTNAAEVIREAAMGIRLGAKIDDFASMLHVYPTMSEALNCGAVVHQRRLEIGYWPN